MTYKTHR